MFIDFKIIFQAFNFFVNILIIRYFFKEYVFPFMLNFKNNIIFSKISAEAVIEKEKENLVNLKKKFLIETSFYLELDKKIEIWNIAVKKKLALKELENLKFQKRAAELCELKNNNIQKNKIIKLKFPEIVNSIKKDLIKKFSNKVENSNYINSVIMLMDKK